MLSPFTVPAAPSAAAGLLSLGAFEAIYTDPRQKRLGSFDGSVELSSDGLRASLLDEKKQVLAVKKLHFLLRFYLICIKDMLKNKVGSLK